MPMIPYGRQEITEADIEAVVAVLKSDFLTQGPMVPAFEDALTRITGAAHAVATNSATAALHLACLALDVGPGDRVWTSAITFAASANCARYCGADVDFVDIDPGTFNMSVEALAAKLADAERTGALPKVVIPVHLCGQSCDMRAIAALAERYGFRIVEDASHAIGGRYGDRPVGACEFSDIAVFSFHPVKIVTTGEGGAAMTDDPGLAERMRLLRTHGITRDPERMVEAPHGSWYYEQVELGFNYRLTDIQAALGVSQLDRLDGYISRRNELAARYDTRLSGLEVTTPTVAPGVLSSFHLYVVRVGSDHHAVFERMREAGIGVNLHYLPMYRHPYYRDLGHGSADYPEAERYYAEAMTLPLYPTLSEAQQDEVVAALGAALA